MPITPFTTRLGPPSLNSLIVTLPLLISLVSPLATSQDSDTERDADLSYPPLTTHPLLAKGDPLAVMDTHIPQHFLPVHGVLGGAIIGSTVMWNALISGRVTGISGCLAGALRDLVLLRMDWYRWAFVVGCTTSGAFWVLLMPESFTITRLNITNLDDYLRMALAALLVGIGSVVGCGCTSGHGVCGLSRLSIRSTIATLTFMGVGVIVTKVTHTTSWLRMDLNSTPSLGYPQGLMQWVVIVVGLVITGVAPIMIWQIASKTKCGASDNGKAVARDLMNLMNGVFFSYGLAVAGMTDPLRVASFLDVFSNLWNATLMFVFVGALPIAYIGFTRYLKFNGTPRHPTPLTLIGLTADLPPYELAAGPNGNACLNWMKRKGITLELLCGSALFGCGWGLAGICPGPALVNLGAKPLSGLLWTYVSVMGVSMAVTRLGLDLIKAPKHRPVHPTEGDPLINPREGVPSFRAGTIQRRSAPISTIGDTRGD
eukprot:GHVN01103674.1.p1 GENE.GHVN01103674.1~~GHVN01103674.1.p1  ORF type:complete len:485 (+),score=42.59 GHVN01103674.1:192-1646(+)